VGLLFVAWGWTVRQLASDPGNDKEMAACLWTVRSTNQQHALGVFFMGSLNFDEDSSSIRDSAISFIPCLLLLQEVEKDWLATTSVDDGEGPMNSQNFFGP
jgi:hypothetical protein